MKRRPPRSTLSSSSAASDVYKRQAWKYFILGSVGIAMALFGTILIYMAARPVIGEGADAMVWTVLVAHAAKFDPALLNVAFVFLLLGYGTCLLYTSDAADEEDSVDLGGR